MANLFELPRYIAVEGPIRVGKSTLARILAERLNAQQVMESEDNPFLSAFYKGEPGAGFQAQFAFMIRRFEQLRALDLGARSRKTVVTDFVFEKDKVFACLNLNDQELETYNRYYTYFREQLPTPDLVIYLQATPEVLKKRLKKKNAPGEKAINEDYLEEVIKAYEHFFFHYTSSDLLTKSPSYPDALTSRRGDGSQTLRDGFGSTIFRYTRCMPQAFYDPISGSAKDDAPARALMYYLHHALDARFSRRWRPNGQRGERRKLGLCGGFKDRARNLWNERWQAAGLGAAGADDRFLVIGEELSRPLGLLSQSRLDGLWNDGFRARIRAAILGQSNDDENFEFTVRNAIDCRNLGFSDLAQAVNYVTSHDVEGFRKERLFTMLQKSGLGGLDLQKRVQLSFVCLLTANGIPMFLAGEEFADQNDLFDANGNVSDPGARRSDPVDFSRLQDPMRHTIFEYVSRLVHLRTSHPALGVNDTEFIQTDFNDNKRVVVWRRGMAVQDPLIVVANFSDYETPNGLTDPERRVRGCQLALYSVWPALARSTQQRDVLPAQVGREPIFPWGSQGLHTSIAIRMDAWRLVPFTGMSECSKPNCEGRRGLVSRTKYLSRAVII